MSRKPSIIQCPNCERRGKRTLRVNRLHRKCAICKIPLVYVGEYFVKADGGFLWTGSRWIPVEELGNTEGVLAAQRHD